MKKMVIDSGSWILVSERLHEEVTSETPAFIIPVFEEAQPFSQDSQKVKDVVYCHE